MIITGKKYRKIIHLKISATGNPSHKVAVSERSQSRVINRAVFHAYIEYRLKEKPSPIAR